MEAIEVIELPDEIIQASTESPEVLVIFSAPKAGKTTLVAQLKDNLVIDLERGSNFVSALKIKVDTYQDLHEVCEKIKAKGKPYKCITIDTVTALEDMVLPLALGLYQQTPRKYGPNSRNIISKISLISGNSLYLRTIRS